MASRIEDYALLGDCEAAALVGKDGSIDWLCWPRFDSDACFAALLGSPGNGRWQIAPSESSRRISRRYRGDTLILETRYETDAGSVLLIDFMPLRGRISNLIRIVAGERGTVEMRTELVIRYGYGQAVPWVSRLPDGALQAISGPDMVVLHTPVRLRGEGLKSVAAFTVAAGDRIPFVLSYCPSHLPPPDEVDADEALEHTAAYWTRCPAWSCRTSIA